MNCPVCLGLGCNTCQPIAHLSDRQKVHVLEARLAMANHSAEVWKKLAEDAFTFCQREHGDCDRKRGVAA